MEGDANNFRCILCLITSLFRIFLSEVFITSLFRPFLSIVGGKDPTKGISKTVEQAWCRSEPKGQACVNIVHAIPKHPQ